MKQNKSNRNFKIQKHFDVHIWLYYILTCCTDRPERECEHRLHGGPSVWLVRHGGQDGAPPHQRHARHRPERHMTHPRRHKVVVRVRPELGGEDTLRVSGGTRDQRA